MKATASGDMRKIWREMALDLHSGTRPDVLTMLGSRSRYNRLMYLGMMAGVAVLLVFGIWASGQGSMRQPLKSQGAFIKRIGVQPDTAKAGSTDAEGLSLSAQSSPAAHIAGNDSSTAKQQSEQAATTVAGSLGDAAPSDARETAATSAQLLGGNASAHEGGQIAGTDGIAAVAEDGVTSDAGTTEQQTAGGGANPTLLNGTETAAKPDAAGG